MENTLAELTQQIQKHALDGYTPTGVPRFGLTRWAEVTGPVARLVNPRMCLVLQGVKFTTVGSTAMEYGVGQYCFSSVDVPAIDYVSKASRERPYLGIHFVFDPTLVATLLLEMPSVPDRGPISGLGVGSAEPEMLDAFLRLVRLMDRPDEIKMIGPLIEREILLRLLRGRQGSKLAQMAKLDSRLSHIRRATAWIRDHYSEPFKVEDLAALVGMSATSFHRHFKAATTMTPIQYQKQFRLYDARQRLLASPGNAAAVAFAVGYESASQFTREYTRMFGAPPIRDAKSVNADKQLPASDVSM